MLLLTKNHFRQGEKEYAIEKEGMFIIFTNKSKNRRIFGIFTAWVVRWTYFDSFIDKKNLLIICATCYDGNQKLFIFFSEQNMMTKKVDKYFANSNLFKYLSMKCCSFPYN